MLPRGPSFFIQVLYLRYQTVFKLLFDVQIKSTGHRDRTWQPTEEELHTAIVRVVDKAAGQLTCGRETVHYIMPDLHLQQVTLVVALPYVTRAQLMKVGIVSADCQTVLLPKPHRQ